LTQSKTASGTARGVLERDALLAARALVDRMRTLYRELERMTDAPITVQLALRLGMQRPAVSHVLKGLAGRGWIERRRHDGDQRSVQLHVTAEGQQILRATGGRAVGTLQRAVRGLSSRELQHLASGLSSLLARLPEPMSQVPSPASAVTRRPGSSPRTRSVGCS
jgi:DNA-binding MarR family transcriptional regulator